VRAFPRLLVLLLAALVLGGALAAQTGPEPDVVNQVVQAVGGAEDGSLRLSAAVEIAVVLTLLSVLPALVITVTSFTRIVIVLSFVRRSLSVNELPPNPVLIALSMFLTMFVMGPVFGRVYEQGYLPYKQGEIGAEQAAAAGWGELRGFLVANTRASEIRLFAEMARIEAPVDDGGGATTDGLPFRVIVPAFVLSELKTSFQMGFLLFLPFLVIDLVVASVLISMGMFMLPPVMISTPFKILLFVLVDGWHLVCKSLVESFVTT
jgi:flagellar biosynthetic protein FliP